MTEYRKLPTTYKENGYTYKLIKRTDKKAMYEVSKDFGIVCYEVIIIRYRHGETFKRGDKVIVVEQHERIPSNNEFGRYWWAFNELKNAEKKYDELM